MGRGAEERFEGREHLLRRFLRINGRWTAVGVVETVTGGWGGGESTGTSCRVERVREERDVSTFAAEADAMQRLLGRNSAAIDMIIRGGREFGGGMVSGGG